MAIERHKINEFSLPNIDKLLYSPLFLGAQCCCMKLYQMLATLACWSFCLSWSQGQVPMWNNQGAVVSIGDSAVVWVGGDLLNDQTGEMDHHGALYVTGNWTNNANNEAFRPGGEGRVHLRGTTPVIGGQSITRFYDLHLEQSGTATAEIDVYIDGYLRLYTQAFFVDTHTVYVYHTALDAVQHTLGNQWGWVGSEAQGGLWRATDTTAAYWYPMGSNRGTSRFRPVQVRPSANAPSAFKVRLVNNDASLDGYDRTRRTYDICALQPDYYHRIGRPLGSAAARLTFYYNNNTDGDWGAIARWTNAQQWDSIQTTVAGNDPVYTLNTLTTINPITQFLPDPMVLAQQSPEATLTAAPNPICADETTTLTAASTGIGFDRYDFYADGQLVQSSASDTYTWRPAQTGTLPLWVVGAFAACGDQSDTIDLTVFDSVVAVISNDTIILAGTAAELRASGGDFYRWLPDTALGCDICPTTTAQPNQSLRYQVEVQNLDGCADTASVWVEVRPSIDDVLFIPNVLTPNNDGFNDTWFIRNIALFPDNTVTIINRWGDVVFSATNYRNNWTGTYSGGPLPAGTYYYVLDVGNSLGIFKGALTIIRE